MAESSLKAYEVGEELALQFNKNLRAYPDAISYLANRGVSSRLIENGKLGFCPPFFEYRFPLLRGRIIVPIRDAHGRVVAFAGRKYEPMETITLKALWDTFDYKPSLAEKKVKQWQDGKWINESFPKGRHLFNMDTAKKAARERNYVVVVEGYLDALISSDRHLENTVATCGVALSEYHLAIIARYCDNIVLIMDPDEAGLKAVEKMRPMIEEAGLRCFTITLPDGLDPDEFVLKFGGKQLRRAIEGMIAEGISHRTIEVKK